MKCVRCGSATDLAKPICPSCGAPIDADLTALEDELAHKRATLAGLPARGPSLVYMSRTVGIAIWLVALVVGGIVFPTCVEPMRGRSIVAARIFCPAVCEGCRGPGRIFGDVSLQVCQNPNRDVDALTPNDGPLLEKTDLAPYELTLWTSVPVDAAIVAGFLFVVVPFFAARMKRKTIIRRRRRLGGMVEDLERRVKEKKRSVEARETTAHR